MRLNDDTIYFKASNLSVFVNYILRIFPETDIYIHEMGLAVISSLFLSRLSYCGQVV